MTAGSGGDGRGGGGSGGYIVVGGGRGRKEAFGWRGERIGREAKRSLKQPRDS